MTNRTGPVNAKYNGFVIIGKELRVGQVIFLQDRCESPVADDIKPRLQGLGASDCKTELSRRNMLADSGTDQTVQRTLVAE